MNTLLIAALVFLNWSDNSTNESAFQIQRAIDQNGFVALAQVAANSTAFTDETATMGALHVYRVRGVTAAGVSEWSNVASATPGVGSVVPPDGVPGMLTAQVEGELVNVSTRGLLTTTDTTLIQGFVVSGGPANVLVRVVGPTLGEPPFNLPGVATDPRFEIRDNAGAVVLTNDDWDNAVVVSEAATRVNAFALTEGSKDSAVVVTLNPGSYTVVARTNGEDGIAIAEVYRIAIEQAP